MNTAPKPPVVDAAASSSATWVDNAPSAADRQLGVLLHLSPLAGYLIPVPGANVLCPLVFWLLKKDESAFLADQGREVVNAQLTICLALLVSIVLAFFLIGIPLIFAVLGYQIVVAILGALAAKEGKAYRYPGILRLLS